MTDPVKPLDNIGENVKEPLAIFAVEEDVLASVAPRGDMIHRTFIFDS
jgi:hypothetical protein